MSLVGPRPERPYYIERIMETAPQYSVLLQLRPGITSWGMVKYGYAGDVFQMIERMRYDLMYLDNCTLPMDLKIIGYTIRTVLTGKGI
jgi:lipopolysaccharide/colanic/teichoic acid biosynthesis glycosyltransferase